MHDEKISIIDQAIAFIGVTIAMYFRPLVFFPALLFWSAWFYPESFVAWINTLKGIFS